MSTQVINYIKGMSTESSKIYQIPSYTYNSQQKSQQKKKSKKLKRKEHECSLSIPIQLKQQKSEMVMARL